MAVLQFGDYGNRIHGISLIHLESISTHRSTTTTTATMISHGFSNCDHRRMTTTTYHQHTNICLTHTLSHHLKYENNQINKYTSSMMSFLFRSILFPPKKVRFTFVYNKYLPTEHHQH